MFDPAKVTCWRWVLGSAGCLLIAGMAPVQERSQASAANTSPSFTSGFVVFPQDCNANLPMCFGGKLLAEMDRCAGITTRRFLYKSAAKDAVTVAINNVTFHKSAEVKDLVIVSGTVVKAGKKSVTVKVTVEKETREGRTLLVEGEFVFVAYDLATKQAVEHGLEIK